MGPRTGNTIDQLHVGSMMEKEKRRQRITFAVLARRINRDSTGLTRLLKRSSIQTDLVWELSVALNFFTNLAQQLDTATQGALSKAEATELEQLKQAYQQLKEERDYLKKAVDLLSKP